MQLNNSAAGQSPNLLRRAMARLAKRLDLPVAARLLWRLGADRRGYITRILLFCIAEAAGAPMCSLATRQAVNAFAGGGWGDFAAACVWIIASRVLWMAFAPGEMASSVSRSRKATVEMRRSGLKTTLSADGRALDDIGEGALLTALSTEAEKTQSLLETGFALIVRSALGGTVGLVLMAVIDWRFALAVMLISFASVRASAYFGERIRKAGEKRAQAAATAGADGLELLRESEAVRLSGAVDSQRSRFLQSAQLEASARRQADDIKAAMAFAETILGGISWFLVLLFGLMMMRAGQTDIGTVAAILGIRYIADVLIVECGQHLAVMRGNIAAYEKLEKVLELKPERMAKPIRDNGGRSALSLKGITFSYAKDVRVLDGLSLELPANGVTLLTGPSGVGKSTLIKLLLGFYEPDEGEIALPGGCATLADLRSKIAYVPQEPTLFRGTILENIMAGREDANPDAALAAAEAAGLDESLLTQGLTTELTDGGGGLSGGQKQRVAIARALLRNAPILLMDEVTSALDASAERKVLETLRSLSKDRAVLLVSHRPLSAEYADNIIEMQRPT